jgi:triacylglycerol lipase
VALVARSMGGLIARDYLQRHGTGRIAKLVTLACPHHGSEMARIGLGRPAREMEPGSLFLRALPERAPPGLATLSVWSRADTLVVPADSARLAGAKERTVPDIDHLAALFSPLILDIGLDELLA